MNSKTWLTVFGVVAVVVIGSSVFYAYSSYGAYKTAMDGWDTKVGTIQTLERKEPYPNKENSEAVKASLEEYEASVKTLFDTLNTFQRPLNRDLANTEFQQRVKEEG